MRLWRNDPETPEGKYPIVLRRDGSPLMTRYLVITLRDPAAKAAFLAYAAEAQRLGYDSEYIVDIQTLALQCDEVIAEEGEGDPMAPRHRIDDPRILVWARSIGCPGG